MLLNCLDLCVCRAYVSSVYVTGEGVSLGPSCFSQKNSTETAHPASIPLQRGAGSVWALIWKLGENSCRFHHNNAG